MSTFVQFYCVLLGFVNFRLYHLLNLYYPPKFAVSSGIVYVVYSIVYSYIKSLTVTALMEFTIIDFLDIACCSLGGSKKSMLVLIYDHHKFLDLIYYGVRYEE
jgi:hypothetical protein